MEETGREESSSSSEDNPVEVILAVPPPRPPPPDILEDRKTDPERNENAVQFQDLYFRYNNQQKEIERLEEQNAEYRERLLNTIKERDLNMKLLSTVRDETKKEKDDIERRLRDSEIQLKAVQDKAAAQESHYSVTMRDLSLKYNNSVGQLTKKADLAEKEKNEAVIKYATREAEIMRVRAETQKKDAELKEMQKVKEELERCQGQENVEHLEKTNNNLKVELERVKHEKFDIENKLKMSEKRADASQTSITELRQQCEVLRKQLIQTKDEKNILQEEHRLLVNKTHAQESRLQAETQEMSRSHSDFEIRLREATAEVARLKENTKQLNDVLEETNRENIDLLRKLQDLEDKLTTEEEDHNRAKLELNRLKNIESQVVSSLEAASKAESAKKAAEQERDIAEKEAEECRLQAERMLHITEQLTLKNSQLAGDAEQIREKNLSLETELIESQGALNRVKAKLSERESDLKDANGSREEESDRLKKDLQETVHRVQELTLKLAEKENDHIAYKKKQTANVKELKQELSALRRQMDTNQGEYNSMTHSMMEPAPSTSSRSRASSLTSLDQATTGSREEEVAAQARQEENSNHASIQQTMIDKIIILQKKLARRNEKIEFLEEHVRQCLDELQKKTKIIQYYALREEASLLLPSDGSLDQVPIAKKGTAYALMGSMFSSAGDKKSQQLVTEINSRLQAVLEEALLKNIALKNSVDSLGNEVSRLSRENRLLSLTQQKTPS